MERKAYTTLQFMKHKSFTEFVFFFLIEKRCGTGENTNKSAFSITFFFSNALYTEFPISCECPLVKRMEREEL